MERTLCSQAHTLPLNTPLGRVIIPIFEDLAFISPAISLLHTNPTLWIPSPRAHHRGRLMNHSEQRDVTVLENKITSISLATNMLHLMCMREQDQTFLCMIQRQVACFRLSMEQLRHPLNSYRIILNLQTQALLIPPPLVWRTGIAHATNPFNSLQMKILIWNCRGAGNPYFRRNFADLIQTHRLEISIIMKTRISGQRAKDISSSLGFDNICCSDAFGFRGGIWILWNLEILFVINQAIHVFMQVCPTNPSLNWILFSIYASPDLALRTELWDDLASFTSSHNLPWLLAEDFNKTLHQHEMLSNSPPNRRRISMFNGFLTNCNLMDLGYCSPRFTWTNKRDNGLVFKALRQSPC